MSRSARRHVLSRLRGPAGHRSRRGTVRPLLASLAVVSLVVSLVQGLDLTVARRSARALALASTGTGGMFVPTQGRVLNTTNGTGGYSGPLPAGGWSPVQVAGLAGVPSAGVSAVQVTVAAIAPASTGTVGLSPDLVTPAGGTALVYTASAGSISNTAIVAMGSNGKIKLEANTSINMVIDVQGYYTDGDSTAAGGLVPVQQVRFANTLTGMDVPLARVTSGHTVNVPVAGLAGTGVPATASAVFADVQVINYSGTQGYIVAYPHGTTKPGTSSDFWGGNSAGVSTSLGVAIPVGADGSFDLYVSGATVDLLIDVEGYFDGSATSGSFTPAAARMMDTRVAPNSPLAANSTASYQVTGRNGVPVVGSGISAVFANIQAINSTTTTGGYLRAWASDRLEPSSTANLTYAPTSIRSNSLSVQVGADGKIKIHNVAPFAVQVIIDLQGWYTTVSSAVPSGQNRTQQSITLQGNSSGGGAWVTYKFRTGTTGIFQLVPKTDVSPAPAGSNSDWPEPSIWGLFTKHTWNIANTLGSAADALVQVQACYGGSATDANPVCAVPSNVQFTPSAFGDNAATEQVGPGTLALLTGDYQVSATDAAAATLLGGLSIGRALTTLAPADAGVAPGSQRAGAAGVFGPGWTASLAGPDGGTAELTVTDRAASGYLLFTGPDGGTAAYQATTPVSSYPISFTGVGDAAGDGEVVTKVNAATITMVDPDNTVTTWTVSGTTWRATSVTQPGSNSTSSYTYNGTGLVTRILAPVPVGVSCSSAPDTTPGCRSLLLNYQTLNVSGLYVTRLQNVQLSIPQTAATANTVSVAAYDYTTAGLLADAYDPRITPNLKTAYSYDASGRLATLTPPGQAAWSFGYDTAHRLATISRPDAANSATATFTIAYAVPAAGASAPVALDASTAGTWNETSDLPVTGTAVFPADHVPSGAPAASDWPYATIHYLDVNGREVNTAQYGAGQWLLDTTQYDGNGNDVWELSARNRAQAVADPSTQPDLDPYVAAQASNVTRANLLALSTVYNPLDPSQVTDSYGSTHPVTLNSGTTIDAQTHVAIVYDENAPNSNVNPATGAGYGLPTTSVTDPFNAQSQTDVDTYSVATQTLTGPSGGSDATVTHTGYAAVVSGDTDGWTLGQATSSTVQMGAGPSSADLVTYTRYDASGRAIESRLPGDSTGTTPRTTRAVYYTATGTGSCVNAAAAGLVCSTAAATQPASGNPLATTSYSYNQYGDPLTKTESYGSSGTVRTTTRSYDPGERPATSSITVTPAAAGGTALPTVTYGYDTATGLPTTTTTGGGGSAVTLSTRYDTLGRAASYTDATGTASATSYDIDGRPVTVNDGKATTTYGYDSTSEHRGLVTSEDIGAAPAPSTFTASYDASGSLATETYPNGLVATTSYDNAGNPTKLAYAKAGATWMSFTATVGGGERIAAQTSPQSAQSFSYDPAGRLTTVQDAYSATCTTRSYGFDAHSNRTSLTSYPAGTGGECSTSTTPTASSSTFDQADRLTNAGYTYDTLGRTATVPAADATGIASHATITGNLNLGYYANDMVATQTQSTATMTFTLDPLQTRIATSTDGTTTTTNHYSGGDDSPAWTSTSSDWTRNSTGIDGNLAATQDNTGLVTLQLTNLHGDVVATAADDTPSIAIVSYSESTEYGAPRTPATAYNDYGWLGGKQRSSNTLAGFTLMGVRLYNPSTGRFLSTDPVPGGNANTYVYPGDPVNDTDVTGCSVCFSHNHLYWNGSLSFRTHSGPISRWQWGTLGLVASLGLWRLTGGLGAVISRVHYRTRWIRYDWYSRCGPYTEWLGSATQTEIQFRFTIGYGFLAYHQTSPWSVLW